ncbi:hypothetical protein [Flavobacterium sp. ACN6]|uniref:hypothetical protein n=1 Tax=Flavobacterium sp. ACN6 TaxID=1920426 RepID=UPI000BB38E84|nr:hypothetical protein [Flavobacterium sp. ACN6]PBJ07977.1 hypothetical protein BSF42_36940 [Flavobacterium sp. ACN6]
MVFYYLLFQILISWLIACGILVLFNRATFTSYTEVYSEAKLITNILTVFNVNPSLQGKLITSRILHHVTGLYFAAAYYLMWYYEFVEVSWNTSFLIGISIGLLRYMSWIFLLEIIPKSYIVNFKGYYLHHIFLHAIFTILILSVYFLFLLL